VIVRAGVRYWTTDEVAASLVARGAISRDGTRKAMRQKVRRWADRVDLRPVATDRARGWLWGEDETRETLERLTSDD